MKEIVGAEKSPLLAISNCCTNGKRSFDQESRGLTWRSRGDFGIPSFVLRMNLAYDISFGATFA